MLYKNIRFVLLLFILFASSCSYKLFVRKDQILSKEKGYLIFLFDSYYFFKSRDTIANDFFSLKNGVGYKLGEFKYSDVFKKIGKTFEINMDFSGNSKDLTTTTIVVLPVELRSLPIENSKLKWEKEELFFYYHGNKISTHYKNANKEILSVYPTNREDIRKFKEYPID